MEFIEAPAFTAEGGDRRGKENTGTEMRTAMANKRDIFAELTEGVAAMKAHRAGKITLRSYKVEARELPEVKPKMIKQVRARFHCSRGVFARKLFTNERTLEKWEQGRAKPNAQAAALLLLAARYPDTFERLEQLAR